jgi:hypothetical protein
VFPSSLPIREDVTVKLLAGINVNISLGVDQIRYITHSDTPGDTASQRGICKLTIIKPKQKGEHREHKTNAAAGPHA